MLHPRDNFLSDIAAFFEINAGKTIHQSLMRKRIAINEIASPHRHAKRNAMRIIKFDGARRMLSLIALNKSPPPQSWQSRIHKREPIGLILIAPTRDDVIGLRLISHLDLGAQPIKCEALDEIADQRARHIDQKLILVSQHDHIDKDLALR